MNPIAGAKKIAAPDPLQTDKEIAIFSRIDPFQFIRESDWPLFLNSNYPTGCPFLLRPIFSSKKGCLVTSGRQRASDASQICFRAAAGRKTAPNKSNVQFLGSLYLHAVSTIIVPMSGETLNPTAPPRIAPRAPRLPKSLLYSISPALAAGDSTPMLLKRCAHPIGADFWAKRSPTTIGKTKFRRRKSDPCAGIRCGSFRRSTGLIIMARRKNTSTGSHRANSGLASMICFTAGRAIAWSPCASRNEKELLRSSRFRPGTAILPSALPRGPNRSDPDNGLQLGAGKTSLSCGRNVPSKNTTLPRSCWYFRKERPRLFARAGCQKKNFSIFHAESMSSVSNQANLRQSFAQFFPAR